MGGWSCGAEAPLRSSEAQSLFCLRQAACYGVSVTERNGAKFSAGAEKEAHSNTSRDKSGPCAKAGISGNQESAA